MLKLLLFNVLLSTGLSQTVHSIKGENSCNVVNVNFGNGDGEAGRGEPGATGKRGPQGPIGAQGQKGERGDDGPMPDVSYLKSDLLKMASVQSCAELHGRYGISTAGYYLMRRSSSRNDVSYRYCDFRVYSGVSTCSELVDRYNISRYGFYRLGTSLHDYRYCPDAHTCHHIAQRDMVGESGFYELGSPGKTYIAYCNFFSGQAITEVGHDSTEETSVSKCKAAGCYTRTPRYITTMEGILNIIKHSAHCRQFIKYRCQGSVLLHHPNSPYGYWMSRDGEKMGYWGGASSKRTGYCACGETGSCIITTKRCNCDENGSAKTQDQGYLTDKSKLPVKEMRFGDTDGAAEFGWHTLGNLECSGEA